MALFSAILFHPLAAAIFLVIILYNSTKKRQHYFDILKAFFVRHSSEYKTSDSDRKVNRNIYPDAVTRGYKLRLTFRSLSDVLYSDECRTTKALPLFRAVVKFCNTNRLLIILSFINSLSSTYTLLVYIAHSISAMAYKCLKRILFNFKKGRVCSLCSSK